MEDNYRKALPLHCSADLEVVKHSSRIYKLSDARKRFQFKFGRLRNALETLSIEFGRVLETRGR